MRRAYLQYRDSGVEWLGDVPAHWEVRPLGSMGSFFKGSGGTKEDEVDDGLPCVRYGDIYTQYRYFIKHTRSFIASENAERYTCIFFGDLLFAGSGETLDEIGKSAVLLIRGPAFCAGDVIVFRPEGPIDATFLGYAADCSTSIYQKSRMGSGVTVMHIYSSELKHLLVLLPPADEQHAIAAFLDRETARTDKLVEKNRLLIERLAEYRTTMITRAVTRGLDPSAPLKPSGIEWLGDIPEHWEVRRLRTLAAIDTGARDTVDALEDGLYPFFVRSQSVEHIDTWSFDGEAVLTAGDGVGVGRVFHYANGKFDYHQRVYKFSNFTDVLGMFFFHYLSSMLRYPVFQGTAKSTVDSLRLPMLKDLPVTVPDLDEQATIVEHIKLEVTQIDMLYSRTETAIERLQEYRAALITAAVTGKIDVREPEKVP